MADTKRGREKQSRDEANRQREQEVAEAMARSDEQEPEPEDQGTTDAADDDTRRCHRRGCDEPATFVVFERYLEETGHGPVEVEVFLCRAHTDEEGPTNLDHAYTDYVYRVEPLDDADLPAAP